MTYVSPQTGHTALQRAASGGHLNIVRSLLAQGASLDHQDELHGEIFSVQLKFTLSSEL